MYLCKSAGTSQPKASKETYRELVTSSENTKVVVRTGTVVVHQFNQIEFELDLVPVPIQTQLLTPMMSFQKKKTCD